MGWGGGWGNHTPRYVEPVIRAWKEGRVKAISKGTGNEGVRTDGKGYYLYEHCIAIHLSEAQRLENMTKMLRSGELWTCSEYSFSFAGYPTKMTARHITALGIIDADCYGIKNPTCYMNGKIVEHSKWYALAEIAELVNPPPKAPRVPREPIFVNLTGNLFDLEACAC